MSKRVVKFLRPSGVYSPGDVAGIPSYQAKKLEGRGVLEFLHEDQGRQALISIESPDNANPAEPVIAAGSKRSLSSRKKR